jgi:hypothetical protein
MAHDRIVGLFPQVQRRGRPGSAPQPADVRLDEQRKFERAVLATAPPGTPLPRL